jgi:SAM-dependent methyltransferase
VGLDKETTSCPACGYPVLAEWRWGYVNPPRTYSPWKKTLKGILVRQLYSKLINYAVKFTSGPGSKLLLKTDLWVECLGIDQLESMEGGFEIVGIDFSKAICACSKPMMANRNILCSDIKHLPFKSASFNIIVDISTIDHVHYSEASGVIGEYARLLKPSGILLVCIDSKLSFPWEVYRKFVLKYEAWSWLWKYAREIVATNGLEIMKAFFANAFLDSFSGLALPFAESRWNRLSSVLAQYYVIIARKP